VPKVTSYLPDTPSGTDFSTIDANKAVAFYGSLFGRSEDSPKRGTHSFYHIQRIDRQSIAGVAQRDEEQISSNIPHVGTFILL